ncbi:hypothetical protein F4604DRAFT_1925838 [Suillus subluteus]|nr:hypothetical protein F4604DRAFT_1925838 [Suillus subluteus]
MSPHHLFPAYVPPIKHHIYCPFHSSSYVHSFTQILFCTIDIQPSTQWTTYLSEGCVLCRSSLLWDGYLSPVTLREFEDMVKKYFVDNPSSYHESLPASFSHFGKPTPTYGHRYPLPPKPDFPPPNSSYITPPTSPDTPSPSYSTSTSPASTASPPTPPGMEDCTSRIISASSSPGIPKHEPVPVNVTVKYAPIHFLLLLLVLHHEPHDAAS